MKLKKIIAGVVTCALAVSCLSSFGMSKIKEVHAKDIVSEQIYTDVYGKQCRVIARFNGDHALDGAAGYKNDLYNLIDGNESGTNLNLGVGNAAIDYFQPGDYIGVLYEEENLMEIQKVRIVYADVAVDRYESSVLQYTEDGTVWKDIDLNEDGSPDYTFTNDKVLEADIPDGTLYAKGIRLVNTEQSEREAWLQIKEFCVETPIEVVGATLEQVAPDSEARSFSAVDQSGDLVTFFMKQNGVPTNYSGAVSALFDGDTSNIITFNNPDYTDIGDYFGVYYSQPITVERLKFVFGWDTGTYARDCYELSHFEYYNNETNAWVRLGDGSFEITDEATAKNVCKIKLDQPVTTNAVRLVKDKDTDEASWLRLSEIMVNIPAYTDYESTDVDALYIKNVTAGSVSSAASNILDGNRGTLWHSNYNNGDTGKINKFWIDVELESLTSVDGVRTFPRAAGNQNGLITEYEIWVSDKEEVAGQTDENNLSWKNDFIKVASGTWDTEREWKTAKFEAVDARHIRLQVVTSAGDNSSVSDNRFASLAEMRITTPTSDVEYVDFWGAGLRRTSTYEKTNMRFGYEIPNVAEGMNATSWEWSWVAEDASKLWTEDAKTVSGTNFYENEAGDGKVSNLVITGIPRAAYTTNVYAQLAITYTIGNEELTVYTDVQVRTVEQVANGVLGSSEESQENKDYAQGLLNTIGQ